MIAQKIKLKLSAKKITYWSYAAIAVAFALASFFSYKFLRDNFYKVITGEKYNEILITSTDNQERLNIYSFNEVIKNINIKTAPVVRETVNNPFD